MAYQMARLALPLLSLAALCTSTAVPHVAAVNIPAAGRGTSPPCSTNVTIQNGNFETGSLSPWEEFTYYTTAGSNITLVSPGRGGSGYAVQLNVNPDNDYPTDASVIQYVEVCPATNYSITFDYKVASADPQCSLSVSMESGETRSAHSTYAGRFSKVGGWKTATFYYDNYIHTQLMLYAIMECGDVNQTAVGLVDNFKIAPIGSLEPAGCPGREVDLPNGDFESGKLLPWVFSGNPPGYKISSPGYNSSFALEVDVPSNTNYWELRQHVPDTTCLAYNYTFTFAVNWGNYTFKPTTPKDGCILLVEPGHCNTVTGGGPIYHPTPQNSGWHEYTYTCTPGSSKGLDYFISLECQNHGGQPKFPRYTLGLDGFTVAPTPA